MKILTVILTALALTGCSNLTPEQNGQLISAGIGLATKVIAEK